MTAPTYVRYYHHQHQGYLDAYISPADGGLILHYHANQQDYRVFYHQHDMQYFAAVGQVPAAIDFADDTRIEFVDSTLPAWLNLPQKNALNWVQKVERSWKWLFVSLTCVLLVIALTFKWLIPTVAHAVAHRLPADTLQQVGQHSELIVLEFTEPSKLSAQKQQHIQQLYQRLNFPDSKLIIRQGKTLAANALALPNRTIVITDELIELAQHDYEILAVLAHEVGHLQHRHSLQLALQEAGVQIFYMIVLGDMHDFLTTSSTSIIEAHYSQNFELQADRFAVQRLHELNISRQYMIDMLSRLATDDEPATTNFMQSHPSTPERIQQIKDLP
ncbi:MAG: M48 family metallopeptidase [Acinetobacter sp.]|nr:M48 family metallopeptidase [Acinetobacter sp.]